MPRPTNAQLCSGVLIVVLSTVALLAVSGESGILPVAVLVAFAVALGTVTTALSASASAHRRSSTRRTPEATPEPTPVQPPAAPSATGTRAPEYAHGA